MKHQVNSSRVSYRNLGSVRVVMAADGTVEQVNHYYAFGGLMGDSSGGDVQKYKYNGKELDRFLNWDMLDYGARWMDSKLQQWPTVDPLAEKDPGISPYVYCRDNPVRYVDPDGRNPTDRESGLIAEDVYYPESKGRLEGGWRRMIVKNMKMNDEKSGFKSALYGRWDEKQGKYTEYVYATAGTDMTSIADWENNFQQVLLGEAEQYKLSVKNARILAKAFKNITFVGHSLGGGLASANSLATGKDAVTFNAAGLSDNTKEKLNLHNTEGYIKAFIVRGEMLDNKQRLIGLNAEGHITYLEHKDGIVLPVGGALGDLISVYAHTMGCVNQWLKYCKYK